MRPPRVRMPKFRSKKTSVRASSSTSVESHTLTADERADARMQGCFSKADKAVLAQWDAAEDWSDVLNLNRAYLRGEQEHTPYYAGPIHDETHSLVPGLLSLHDLGLLTIQSQPSSDTGVVETQCSCGRDPPWSHVKQRAYISFLIPQGICGCEVIDFPTVMTFLDQLMMDDKLYTAIINYDGTCRLGGCKKDLWLMNNFPDVWASHKARLADSEELLEDAVERDRQIFEVDCPCQLRHFKSQLKLMAHMSPHLVHVMAKSWDESDLPGLVEAVAERAGLGRLFAEYEEDHEVPELDEPKDE